MYTYKGGIHKDLGLHLGITRAYKHQSIVRDALMNTTTLGCLLTWPPHIVEAEIPQLCPKDLDVFSL